MNEHRHHSADHHLVFDSPHMAAFAELEGEVLAGLVEQGAAVLAGLCHQHGVEARRLVDLGCGPGVGTCLLAQRFPGAAVVAVDGSATMLEHANARAGRLELSSRVEARQAELPGGLGAVGEADVVWASMVLHHVGDEVTALREVHGLLKPGGLLALVEHAGPVRFLPDSADLGRPGIWARLDTAWAAWFADMRSHLAGAIPSAGYPAMLKEAGFDLLADEVLTVALDAPLGAQAARFAQEQLRRTQAQLAPYAPAADLAALDALIDGHTPDGALRPDAVVRAARQLYVARAA